MLKLGQKTVWAAIEYPLPNFLENMIIRFIASK